MTKLWALGSHIHTPPQEDRGVGSLANVSVSPGFIRGPLEVGIRRLQNILIAMPLIPTPNTYSQENQQLADSAPVLADSKLVSFTASGPESSEVMLTLLN
ncbi:unnamed protein product [Ilex paraguariensis]|uniref:Uncharacterized protein n=1 Tax=Ilex paraguariensis TaxID=185542 RepID=A0ABC8U9D6_9AQUA